MAKYNFYEDEETDEFAFEAELAVADEMLDELIKQGRTICVVNATSMDWRGNDGWNATKIDCQLRPEEWWRRVVGGGYDHTLELAIDTDKGEGEGGVSSHDCPMGSPRHLKFYTPAEVLAMAKEKHTTEEIAEELASLFELTEEDEENPTDEVLEEGIDGLDGYLETFIAEMIKE